MSPKEKKRPMMSIAGRPVDAGELHTAVSAASTAWLGSQRVQKAKSKRQHRALSQAEREAKAQATAQAKKQRQAEREARELDRLLARVGYLSRRSAREAEAMLRVHVTWKPSARPKITTVCPRSLYSRMHPEVSDRIAKASTRSRIAADGFKNIVLRKIPRGYGRKAQGTRAYRPGEAADLARYMLRGDALERDIQAAFTNIIAIDGEHALYETDALSIDEHRCAQLASFWNALEAFEAEADEDGNVFSHLILAMPSELSPEGRSRAMADFCQRLDEIHLPYLASLHRPDPDGDSRNFHAHIMMAPRPFSIEGPFAWSFEAGKATEFNLGAGIGWLRERAAQAFNRALEHEDKAIRYTGVSQANRGVPATGETHDGPVVTARKRKAEREQSERERLVRGLATHVAQAIRHQSELGARIDQAMARNDVAQTSPSPASQPQLPPALAALRQRFPDPRQLKGLTLLDLMDFTPADEAADRWFAPALNLAIELQRDREGLVRDRDGKPELVEEKLKPEYAALASAPELPDIVREALIEAHRRLVDERERKKRIARENEEIRQDRLAWLRAKGPVLLFDASDKVLPEFLELFPPAVVALDGVRQAMVERHRARQEEDRRIIEERRAADEPTAATLAAPEPQPPAAQPPAPEPEEDEDWNLLLQAAQADKVPVPGKGGTGKG